MWRECLPCALTAKRGDAAVHAELLLEAGLTVDIGVLAGELELAIEVDGPTHFNLRRPAMDGVALQVSPSMTAVCMEDHVWCLFDPLVRWHWARGSALTSPPPTQLQSTTAAVDSLMACSCDV